MFESIKKGFGAFVGVTLGILTVELVSNTLKRANSKNKEDEPTQSEEE